MKTSKNIIIGLLIVIIMILAALVVLFATGTLAFHTKGNFNNQIEETSQTENNQSNFSKDDQSSDLNYQFGDDLKISELINLYVDDMTREVDLSNWHVLHDDGEYITAMSDVMIAKQEESSAVNTLDFYKSLFKNSGVDFGTNGDLRLLNQSVLVSYFGCNFDDLTCSNNSSWLSFIEPYKTSLTSVEKDNKVVSFNFNNTLSLNDKGSGIYPIFPILVFKK